MKARNAVDLLAVDPSLRSTGVALFRRGELVAARRIQRKTEGASLGVRALGMAQDVVAWIRHCRVDPQAYVYEFPQIYTATKSDGDPNDLTPLAAIGSAIGMALIVAAQHRNITIDIATPLPAEWSGQLPKTKSGDPWASPRGARIHARLTPAELRRFKVAHVATPGGSDPMAGVVLEPMPEQHDVLDAIGLGLWALGRFDRVRVFPGAT